MICQVVSIVNLFLGAIMPLTYHSKANLSISGILFMLMSNMIGARSVSMQTIGSMHMQSFGIAPEQKMVQEEIKDPKKALALSLSEAEQRRLVYQLCAQFEAQHGVNQTTDDESIKNLLIDLEIFVNKGQQPQDTVFNRTIGQHTYTLFGQAMGAKMLACPETSSTKLLDRQAFIQELTSNDQLFNHLTTIIESLKTSQDKLLSFWKEDPKLTQKLITQLYFNKQSLKVYNKNSVYLEFLTCLDHLKTVYSSTSLFTTMTIMAYVSAKILRKLTSMPVQSVSLFQAATQTLKSFNPWNIVSVFRNIRSKEFQETNIDLFKQQLKREPTSEELAAQLKLIRISGYTVVGVTALMNALFLYSTHAAIKSGIDHTVLVRDTANFIQDRLIGVAAHLRALDAIHALAKEHPSLYQAIPTLKDSESLFACDSHDDLHTLVQLLMTKTFTGKASFFSLTGRVLASYTLMHEQKDNLIPALMTIGEIDACLASAKLYRENQDTRVIYSFAEYQKSETPHIKVTEFWNPLVDKKIVVTNSMELGTPLIERNMILTGSNTGGKSTMLKAMVLNVLLAQTITIVPAQSYIATPFTYISTYMNINDDTATGNSLFKAEVLRAKKLLESITQLDKHDFGFVVIDELFTGTEAEKAAAGATKVALNLSQAPNACFILATHFTNSLPALEQATNGICKNYKIDADKNSDGIITRSFKLEPGISSNNIALEILRQELNDVFLEL